MPSRDAIMFTMAALMFIGGLIFLVAATTFMREEDRTVVVPVDFEDQYLTDQGKSMLYALCGQLSNQGVIFPEREVVEQGTASSTIHIAPTPEPTATPRPTAIPTVAPAEEPTAE